VKVTTVRGVVSPAQEIGEKVTLGQLPLLVSYLLQATRSALADRTAVTLPHDVLRDVPRDDGCVPVSGVTQ